MKEYTKWSYEPKVIYHVASTSVAYRNGDLKTERMWMEEGYRIKPGAKAYKMWHNCYHQKLCDYYFRDEVEEINSTN